ncbi:hypothetical protein Tco_0363848 [Tanacetum coccineum]
MGDEDLNFIPNKELDKEDLIPIPRESKIGKECDFPLCDDFQNDEEIISIEVSRQISPKVNSEPSIESPISSSPSLSSSEASEYSLDEFADELALIDFSSYPERDDMTTPDMSKEFVLDDMSFSPKELNWESLPKRTFCNDDDLFEWILNNDEWKRIFVWKRRILRRMDSDSD